MISKSYISRKENSELIEIKVKNEEEALNTAISFLPTNNLKVNICFTGGNFGIGVLKGIKKEKFDISNWSIFQTDERIDSKEEEIIQIKIISNLINCKGFDIRNCNFFPHNSENEELDSPFGNLKLIPNIRFDITFLSLGEDGHLAGHFESSVLMENKQFCYTENAPKLPKKRVSFKLERLLNSELIILACLGENKKEALQKLLAGENIHHELMRHKRLVLIKD